MACNKIENLTVQDLEYLEKVLGKEFSKQNEYISVFKSKNSYEPVSDTRTISKLMDAIRSEKDYRYKRSIKW